MLLSCFSWDEKLASMVVHWKRVSGVFLAHVQRCYAQKLRGRRFKEYKSTVSLPAGELGGLGPQNSLDHIYTLKSRGSQ